MKLFLRFKLSWQYYPSLKILNLFYSLHSNLVTEFYSVTQCGRNPLTISKFSAAKSHDPSEIKMEISF